MLAIVLLACLSIPTATAKPNAEGAVTSRVINPDTSIPSDAAKNEAGKYFQGDIDLPAGADASNRNFRTDKDGFWPDAKVCYYFDSSATSAMKDAVNAAIKDYETFSCVRFHEKTSTDTDCIRIFKGQGCYASLGRQGGEQDLSLGEGCQYKGIAIHEMLHSLGYTHEQSRGDRDDYVEMLWENIEEGKQSQFRKADIGYSAFGFPYDYGSVMHYGSNYFTKNGQDVMLAKDKTRDPHITPQREGFSELDLKKLNKAYCDTNKGPGGVFLSAMDITPYQQGLVDLINNWRRYQGASNMWRIEWDNNLAQLASTYATDCIDRKYQATPDGKAVLRVTANNLYDNDAKKSFQTYGEAYETMYKTMAGDTKKQCCMPNGWCFTPCTIEYGTMMVNAATKKVGCALAKCSGLKPSNLSSEYPEYFVPNNVFQHGVCVFDVPNNRQSPFTVGKPCSACSGSTMCDNGLCSAGPTAATTTPTPVATTTTTPATTTAATASTTTPRATVPSTTAKPVTGGCADDAMFDQGFVCGHLSSFGLCSALKATHLCDKTCAFCKIVTPKPCVDKKSNDLCTSYKNGGYCPVINGCNKTCGKC